MKTELAKSKLENLCREMQKAQRKAHEEHVERLRELERNRKDMIEQFKESLIGIQVNNISRSKKITPQNLAGNAKVGRLGILNFLEFYVVIVISNAPSFNALNSLLFVAEIDGIGTRNIRKTYKRQCSAVGEIENFGTRI